ncbi:hypothetical protein [Cystobacter fuscus]|uniref:hypothetical protein n=1 Tax=Cystobacter fuscus TaxID=43 RepID=UPI002B2FD947|nr:hypothetical protein F0U63_44440 [Cystobacter fuscus]
MRREAIILLTGLLWALGAGAQTPTEAPPTSPPDNEMSGEASIYARPRTPPRLEAREGRLVRPGDRVDANDVLDEIIDEFAADVARLGANRISPILLERVRVSENMNPEFASVFEARLIAAIYRAANVRVVRCYECYATHAEVENGTWVVRRGLSRREDLQQVMKKYNAQVVLNASLTLYTAPNSFAFDVEMVRGEDASVFFAEGYRVHPHTALLYRSADKVQHREARLKDLEDRINAKPRFNHSVHLGAIVIPTQNHPDGAIWAPYTAYRFTEAFGEERTWRAGGTVAAIINPTRIGGALLEATLLSRINPENVYSINCFAGGSAGFFVTGATGNSPMFNAQAECVLAHRITLQASLGFLVPFASSEDSTYFVGGLTPQVGMGFTW